jgi:hypothetical protein
VAWLEAVNKILSWKPEILPEKISCKRRKNIQNWANLGSEESLGQLFVEKNKNKTKHD